MRYKPIVTAVLVFIASMCLCASPAEAIRSRLFLAEPLLVDQPAYAGMRFYVYRPYDMPSNWYLTFDGYPVTKNRDGVWVYGTFAGPSLTATNYVVGSVVPAMAGLSPYTSSLQVSSARTLPPPVTPGIAVQQPQMQRIPEEPVTSTYMPDWLFNSRFMALGGWKDSVDRIGILHSPSMPVAWRGNFPKVIYAWNGHGWFQMMAREGQTPFNVLRSNIYALTRQASQNRFVWYEADMPVLSQQASAWGYYWMGEIIPR